MPAGIVVYGDASGNNAQTTGNSDYQIMREFLHERNSNTTVEFRVPKANPHVRERVNLMNAKLKPASGEIQLLVDRRCKELIKDFEQVAYKEDSNQIDKEQGSRAGRICRTRWGTWCGRSAGRNDRSERGRERML